MLQYTLNLTAIWLISLVVFDLMLRKESYHRYNRFYLVATFIAGMVIPLCRWEHSIQPAHTLLRQPMTHLITAGKEMTGLQEKSGIYNWLLGIYIAGLCVTISVLLADTVKLMLYYINGKKTKKGKWTIIETHREHAPFSFLNVLFISSIKLYNADEWDMLSMHEQQHVKLLHFADVALLQVARVAFWFHPLVYIYCTRLRLVHEYQADTACQQPQQVYGKFLVDQMLLQSAPAVAHALSNAPVKRRILMLSHKSPRHRRLAQLAIFPLIALFIICFTRYDVRYQDSNYPAVYVNPAPAISTASYLTDFNNRPKEEEEESQNMEDGKFRLKREISIEANKRAQYEDYKGSVIMIAGMENNANARCCSSNLLWGSNYSDMVSQNFAAHNPVLLAEYAGNSCAPAFDARRNDQYRNAVEDYKVVQESWGEYVADNIFESAIPSSHAAQIVVANDPWSAYPEKGPGMVPPLSIDRSVFGPNEKTIFSDAVAMACPVKTDAPPLQFSPQEQKNLTLKPRGGKLKNTPYTP